MYVKDCQEIDLISWNYFVLPLTFKFGCEKMPKTSRVFTDLMKLYESKNASRFFTGLIHINTQIRV